ncbi:MAG: arginine decarboxylase, partial [Geopsychrobacter sp.]|nr:arginine decarboxylase [Geopsychrobacter sp.]
RDYRLEDYCQTLVSTIGTTLDPLGIDHPQIITESGRATVADSSVLLFNVLGAMHFDIADEQPTLSSEDAPLIHKLADLFKNIESTNHEKTYQQAIACRDQARNQFRTGHFSLRQRAQGEKLFLMIARRVLAAIPLEAALPKALIGLRRNLADIYYGNFSVFQSLPDTWAIGQTFPLLPIERHNEPPCRDAMISDLTCDCDGKLDNFNLAGVERPTLPLHPLKENQDYLLGVFLMGAYQETLGDLHNLFGDTHTLNVKLLADGGFELQQEIEGDSIGDLLSYIEYDPRQLEEQLRLRAEQAVRDGNLNINERKNFLDVYRQLFRGYSYFKTSDHPEQHQ